MLKHITQIMNKKLVITETGKIGLGCFDPTELKIYGSIWPGVTTPKEKLNIGICTGINSLPKTYNVGGCTNPSQKLHVTMKKGGTEV